MNRSEIIWAIRAQEAALRAEGVAHLALFGSRARDDALVDSDLDVLIDVAPGKHFSLLNVSGVGLRIEDAIRIPCQVVLRRSLPPDFAARIRDDLVPEF
jgi:uncharacterized protein